MVTKAKPAAEDVATSPIAGAKVPESSWRVEVLDTVKDIQPSRRKSGEDRMATHFRIERPNGTLGEVESTRTILKITNKNGVEIEVPASIVHHITSLHLKGEEAGSRFTTESLEASFKAVAERLPQELSLKDGQAAFEMDLDQIIGTEGVSSQREMLARGVATREDLERLAAARDEVFKLNISATDDEKEKLVDEFNARASGNVKLGLRSGAITPFFRAERQPTSRIFLVVGKEKDADGSEHVRLLTMAPGRLMGKLPTDGKFTGRVRSEGVAEGTTVADLLGKVQAGVTLSSEEQALVDAQKNAQECWWNGGFISRPEET